jgi:peptide chain release factor 1
MMDEIFDKLQSVADRYDELNELISDPDIIADTQKFMKLSKEEGSLRETVEKYNEYKKITQQVSDDEELLREKLDPEMEELTKEELAESKAQQEELEQALRVLLLPKDPNDDKNIIMEIHGAAGGDEASLFAGDLFEMYTRYAEKQGWTTEVIDKNETEVGGFKEIVLMITGNSVYSKLKYENGAHRFNGCQ